MSYKDLSWNKPAYRQGEISGIVRPKSDIVLLDEPFRPGTIKPESDYMEFSRLGMRLGLPCPQVHISIESRAADGSLVAEFKDRSRTFNRNYWTWLFKAMAMPAGPNAAVTSDTVFGAGHLATKQTSGTVSNATNSSNVGIDGSAVIANSTRGIVVGTGVGAEDFEGFALGTPIVTGNGAGQLAYQAIVNVQPTYSSLVWTQVYSRIFNNNSGGTITIGEVGIYAVNNAGGSVYMITRDKLGSTVPVLNAGQLTATYTFTLTFPA